METHPHEDKRRDNDSDSSGPAPHKVRTLPGKGPEEGKTARTTLRLENIVSGRAGQ